MSESLSAAALNQLFLEARTFNKFQAKPVDDALLKALVDLMRWGPTSMNGQPARIVFVRSSEGKKKLKPALSPNNVEKTMAAPVTAILAYDPHFQELLPKLLPIVPNGRAMFDDNDQLRETTALRSATLQGAYVILAARALGLDSGAMSGFSNAAVDEAFFPDGKWKSNFLLNLGYGDASGTYPRSPRLEFDEMARFA